MVGLNSEITSVSGEEWTGFMDASGRRVLVDGIDAYTELLEAAEILQVELMLLSEGAVATAAVQIMDELWIVLKHFRGVI
jgi:hypothetical protein